MSDEKSPHIIVDNLTMAYGEHIIQRDLNFTINRGEVFAIMGDSGCGKSTLMKHMIGIKEPLVGDVIIAEQSLWRDKRTDMAAITKNFGVLYQTGALFSSMTLAENVEIPLTRYTKLKKNKIREIAEYKLALVGLAGYEDYFPSEISGGMSKRAGLARAMALDPEILFFDEPSAGLDPISSKRLDDLILELRQDLDTTIVIVTHELASIFAIADNAVFLDADLGTMTAVGSPQEMLTQTDNHKLQQFLTREANL